MAKPILCLDFDGVLHSYTSGWSRIDEIRDPPVPGAMLFLATAVQYFKVAIFSSRSATLEGRAAMTGWVQRALVEEFQGDGYDILDKIDFPSIKPPAKVAIDDRVITFTGEWPDMQTLLAFQPWNKK